MGQLVYGYGSSVEVEDRVLDHVRRAVEIRFRRGESFMIDIAPASTVSGASHPTLTAWLAPGVPVAFVGECVASAEVNVAWVRALAASGRTMNVGTEPAIEESTAPAPINEAARVRESRTPAAA
ncbi:hypothetical protein [uncultured Microbacterium sp.]|jgi:hypothetical protein|uniref:DUF7882 family protein n=1 Tax=uncultured Microbacterium sp. TaxID=191216 RepID=UPI0025CD5357|nr:hypothetical protein [uncultured Microbacterium sp.]